MVITFSEMQKQLQSLLGKLENYKETNHHLQFSIKKQEINNMLTKKENHRLKECIKQLTMHIEELRNGKRYSQNLQGKDMKKEIVESKDERCNDTYKTKIHNIVLINMLECKASPKRKAM